MMSLFAVVGSSVSVAVIPEAVKSAATLGFSTPMKSLASLSSVGTSLKVSQLASRTAEA